MLVAFLTWAYLSPMPFVWLRTFFGLRGHRGLGARWLLASGVALVWPLFAVQFVAWRHFRKPDTALPEAFGDQVEAEFRSLYP